MNSVFLLLLTTILHVALGLEVIIDYSFRLPTSPGTASPSEAECCPYVKLPLNRTRGMVPPIFFGIGTQKGGTTSLYYQLKKHPQMHGAAAKEMHFLDEAGSESYRHYLEQWWYNKRRMKQKEKTNAAQEKIPKLLFEFSPSYMFVPYSACKAKIIAPNAKFVVLLRDPADRAYSGFTHAVNVISHWFGRDHVWMKATFWEAMEQGILEVMNDPRCDFQNGVQCLYPPWMSWGLCTGRGTYSYNDCLGCMLRWREVHLSCDARPFVNIYNDKRNFTCTSIGKEHVLRGLYGAQLAWWFTLFDPSRFMILNSKTYFKNPLGVLKNVTEFLNLKIPYDEKMYGDAIEKANVGHYHKTTDAIMVAETKAVLRQFYKRPNLELYRLLRETGFPDFVPFEPQLQNIDLIDCSDDAVIAKGTCGTTLFISNDKGSDWTVKASKQPTMVQHKAPAIKAVTSEDLSPVQNKDREQFNDKSLTPISMSPISQNGTSTGDQPKDLFPETTSMTEIQQLNQSQGEASFDFDHAWADSMLNQTKEVPFTALNTSVEGGPIEFVSEKSLNEVPSLDPDMRMRMGYLPNTNLGSNIRFQMSSSDRFFRSLSAIVLIGLLFYIFRSLRRNRINPRISNR